MAPTHSKQSTDPRIDGDFQFPEPQDRGRATTSQLGCVEYVEALIRPGRILVLAAEETTGTSFMSFELAAPDETFVRGVRLFASGRAMVEPRHSGQARRSLPSALRAGQRDHGIDQR